MSAGRERTEDIRNEEARIKRLLGLDVARLAIGADFEGTAYTPLGVNVIEFVNISTSIAASQTGSGGPAQVTGLSAVVNSQTQITLSWTAVSGATSYNVYISTVSGSTGSLAGNVTSAGAISSGLTAGTTYYYQVAAVNAIGEGTLSSQISATTTTFPPPAQVTGLTVTVIGNNQLNLAWTAVSGATSYNVYRSTTSGTGFAVIASPTSNSYNNTGLSQGTTYYYKVSAENAQGEGPLSTQASGTTTGIAVARSLWLELNNDFSDSSGNGSVVVNNFSLFATPGKFGSHYLSIDESGGVSSDTIKYIRLSNNTNIRMDLTTVGFSVSFWFRGTAVGGGGYDGVVIHKCDSTTAPITGYCVEVKGNGKAVFVVQRDVSTIYRFEKGGLFTDSTTWRHIACTFNAATNAGVVYVDGVAGTSSSEGVWGAFGSTTSMYIGKHPTHSTLGDGTSYIWGDLDEIQYFKGLVLTSTQVNNLKNTNAP